MAKSAGSWYARFALPLILVGLSYYTVARLSLSLALIEVNVTPLWPATGVAVLAFWSLGVRAWPAVLLPALVVNAPISGSVVAAAAIALGNTVVPLMATRWLRRRHFRTDLDRWQDVVLLGAAALGWMLLSAAVGATSLLASGVVPVHEYLGTWSVWWAGDTMGVLTLAPLGWTILKLRRTGLPTGRHMLELAALLTALVAVGWFVVHSRSPRLFVMIPVLGFLAWRQSQLGAAAGVLVAASMAAWAAAHGIGPFGDRSVLTRMLTLQTFNAVATLPSLFFGAVVSEQRRSTQELTRARADLQTRVVQATAALEETNRRLAAEIKDRTAAQEEARLRADELAEAQAVANVGSWSWDILANTTRWSAELLRIYGVAPEEFVSGFAGYLRLVHPDDRDLVEQSVRGALTEGTSFDLEHRLVRPDGTTRIMRSRGLVVRDMVGQAVRLVGTGQDITGWKEAVDALMAERARVEALSRAEEERRRLEELFLQAPQAVVVTRGSSHVIDFANPAFFAAFGDRNCLGQPAAVAFPEMEGQGYLELLDRVFSTGRSYRANESPLRVDRNGDGELEEAFFNLVYQPLRDDRGEIEGILGYGLDVTEMVRARREVEVMAAELGELYERELGVTELLQRSFLPERLPALPGLALAGRYVPGSADADVGGDWYDALALPDGQLVLVIGDVEGHGLRSATFMSQLRNALRAYVLEDPSPQRAIDRVRHLAVATEAECFATVLCVTVDPSTLVGRFARAGHLPPLLLSAGGTTRFLDGAGSAPLGAPDLLHSAEGRFELEPGSTLVLFTDGLVERRDVDLDVMLDRLAAAAAAGPCPLDELVDHLLAEVAQQRADDVALLALRVVEPPRPEPASAWSASSVVSPR